MPALSAQTLEEVARRVPVPAYDRREVRAGIVHIGVGGFHRAHQAMYLDRLLNDGQALDWGICGVGMLPGDRRMKEVLDAQDGLYTLVVKHADGTYEPRVIGSIVEYLLAPDDPEAVVERMTDPAIRIVTLTVTEGGYNVDPVTGEFDAGRDDVARDLEGNAPPRTTFGVVVEGLRRRRERGIAPFTVVSCDNLQGNGALSRAAFSSYARRLDPDLGAWVQREVAFPNTMVDRITPVTSDADRAAVRERFGIDDRWPVVCEPFDQWLLEDEFPTGRPPLQDAGARFVDDVAPYETMKVRLLNGTHQALAYFGVLLGHRTVDEAAADERIRAFLTAYMEREAQPTLPPVPGVDLRAYEQTLIERFSNPQIGDSLARVCALTSDRIPIFVLPVARDQLAAGGEVGRVAAVVASWARYAEGTDEDGRPIEVVDALRDRVVEAARRDREEPGAFLADPVLFGDLGADERFAAAYRAARTSLRDRGVAATLAALT